MFVSNKSFPFWNGFGLIGLDTIPPPKAAQDQGDRRGGNCRKHFWKQDVWAAVFDCSKWNKQKTMANLTYPALF